VADNDPETGESSVTELNAATGKLVKILRGHLDGLKFGGGYAVTVASDRTHVWVADADGSVFEFSAATGTLIKVLHGHRHQFTDPDAITFDGTHVWVTNPGSSLGAGPGLCTGGQVTELDASGKLVKVLSSPSYKFAGPDAVAAVGGHIWVANLCGYSVTEFPAS
jgi:DNA-binding beta-propeller fold protein YncE